MDITAALRDGGKCTAGCSPRVCVCGLCEDAADEIERLRAEAAEWQATLGSIESARQQALDEIDLLRAALQVCERAREGSGSGRA